MEEADNTASVYASTVSGGYRNKAINIHSTVSGGNDNVASGDSSTVSGGQKNEATGDHSTVSGGWLNTASGDYSWAGGKFAKTGANNNTFAWSDGYGSIDLAAIPIPNAANQFAIKAAGGLRLLDGNEGTAGYVLTADAAGVGTWQAVTLSELTDVDFGSPGPVDGQVLTYSDSSPSGWVAADSTGSGSGDSLTEDVTQVGHSFTIGDPVYYASSAWVASDAGAENTAEVLGIVTSVAGNDFTVTLGGRITGLSGLTADSIYYLGVGGGMDLTEPSTVDQVSKPIFYSTSTTDGIFLQMRGSTVTDGSVQVDFGISGGAETDVLAANTKVATLHITRDMTLEEVLVSVNTSVSSQIATFDIQLNDNSSPGRNKYL